MSIDKDSVRAELEAQLGAERWVEMLAKENNQELPPARSNRLVLWDCFSDEVGRHVEEYTVPQYGDLPDDNVAKWSDSDCVKQIQKYANRLESNARGEMEAARDLLKIAHYASLVWCKRLGFEDELVKLRADIEAKVEDVAEVVADEDVANAKSFEDVAKESAND